MIKDRFHLISKHRKSFPIVITTFLTCLPFALALAMLALMLFGTASGTPSYPGVWAMILFGLTIGALMAIAQIKAVFFDGCEAAKSIASFYWLVSLILSLGFVVSTSSSEERATLDGLLTHFVVGLSAIAMSSAMAYTMTRHARVLKVVQRRNPPAALDSSDDSVGRNKR